MHFFSATEHHGVGVSIRSLFGHVFQLLPSGGYFLGKPQVSLGSGAPGSLVLGSRLSLLGPAGTRCSGNSVPQAAQCSPPERLTGLNKQARVSPKSLQEQVQHPQNL